MNQHPVFFALPLVWALLVANVQAQTLYRCGNTYQDKPCVPGQQGKVVGTDSGRAGDAKNAAPGDAQCSQRGVAAQKIVWSREAGALEAQMLDKARNDDERELITEVYRQRATAPEMKRIIEANCIKEKQLAAQSPKPNPATKAAANAGASKTGKSDRKNEASDGADTDEAEKEIALAESEKKKVMCAKLREEILHTISLQRRGGSHEEMEAYNKRKQALDSQFFRAGC